MVVVVVGGGGKKEGVRGEREESGVREGKRVEGEGERKGECSLEIGQCSVSHYQVGGTYKG